MKDKEIYLIDTELIGHTSTYKRETDENVHRTAWTLLTIIEHRISVRGYSEITERVIKTFPCIGML